MHLHRPFDRPPGHPPCVRSLLQARIEEIQSALRKSGLPFGAKASGACSRCNSADTPTSLLLTDVAPARLAKSARISLLCPARTLGAARQCIHTDTATRRCVPLLLPTHHSLLHSALPPLFFPATEPQPLEAYEFKHDPKDFKIYWDVRRGLIPIVGAARKPGTSMLLEDVACPVDKWVPPAAAAWPASLPPLTSAGHCLAAACCLHSLHRAWPAVGSRTQQPVPLGDLLVVPATAVVLRPAHLRPRPPPRRLGQMTVDLMDMFQRHSYEDAFLFGHALEGNLHLVFSQVWAHAAPVPGPHATGVAPVGKGDSPAQHARAGESGITCAGSPHTLAAAPKLYPTRRPRPPHSPGAGLPHARGGAALPRDV